MDVPDHNDSVAFHPLANLFPFIEGEDFTSLVDDIRENGLREPVVMYEDAILDGRNRYRACRVAGIEPRFTNYDGDDAAAFVVSLNLRRRHLTESQRAMVAAKLANMKRGENQHSPIGGTSQAKAAEMLNVGKRSVERANVVQTKAVPEIQDMVTSGAVPVSTAAKIAAMPKEEQAETVKEATRAVEEETLTPIETLRKTPLKDWPEPDKRAIGKGLKEVLRGTGKGSRKPSNPLNKPNPVADRVTNFREACETVSRFDVTELDHSRVTEWAANAAREAALDARRALDTIQENANA